MPRGVFKHKPHQGFQKENKVCVGRTPWNKNKIGYHINTEEWKNELKTRKYNLGKHWTIKDTSNMNKSKIGKKWSEETKQKMSEGKQGDKNPAWKGGCIKNERNDPAYQLWVKEVKKRDNNTCWINDENCWGYNIVHHIKNWPKYFKLRYELTNGITLCQAHHPRERAKEKLFERLFSYLVVQK